MRLVPAVIEWVLSQVLPLWFKGCKVFPCVQGLQSVVRIASLYCVCAWRLAVCFHCDVACVVLLCLVLL